MKVIVKRQGYSSLKLPPFWRQFKELPLGFLLLIYLLIGVGCVALYSAAGGQMNPWASAQLVRVVAFTPVMLLIAMLPQSFWLSMSPLIYAGGVAILVAVLLIGVEGGLGAQRWINLAGFKFQPSELMKVGLVIMLAYYYHRLHASQISHLFFVLLPAVMIGLPCVLVLLQPNLGTAAIIGLLGVMTVFMAGVNWRYFLAGIVLLACLVPILWFFVMHDYQKQRVTTFLDPDSDPLGAGYNIIQSKIAIGSGGFMGKGFVQGTQSQLAFLPEHQTDFLFAIFAEEFGFVGSLILLGLYMLLITGSVLVAFRSQELFGRLIAFGMSSIIFLHVFINMGMVMGIMPVVGVPLPLLSYGGSSMLATMIALGFILNTYMYRDKPLPKNQ